MDEGTAVTARLGRRRIIERPRLTRLLDESPERIKLLVAPAGYGKTTLARQWLADQPTAWFSASSGSIDVVALARGLISALRTVIPSAGLVLLDRLSVTVDSEAEVDLLVEILAPDLRDWPTGAWVVMDDYHAVTGVRPAERFIEALLLAAPINLIVISRSRPTWASARRVLYGEIQELTAPNLAMTIDEIRQLLVATPEAASEFHALSGGWPALVALRSHAPGRTEASTRAFRIYEFLAHEVFSRLDTADQKRLMELALYTPAASDFALDASRPADEQRFLERVRDAGFLGDSPEGRLYLHPLLRTFLIGKLKRQGVHTMFNLARGAFDALLVESRWDDASDLLETVSLFELLPTLIERATVHLLRTGRVVTLRRWVDRAPVEHPAVRLASAELAFRAGRFHESEALARLAADDSSATAPLKTESFLVAGRAAHAAGREEEALELYRIAGSRAESPDDRRRAHLGELSAAIDLESPDAFQLLETLLPVDTLKPTERAIVVTRMLSFESRFCTLVSIDEGHRMWQLLPHVADPLVRSSFRNTFGYVLAACALYDDAERITQEQLEDADRYRLDFVVPYALTVSAMVHAGRRAFPEAETLLAEAEDRAMHARDDTAFCTAWAVSMRAFFAQGAYDSVFKRPLHAGPQPAGSLQAELYATVALAFAASSDPEQAVRYAEAARAASGSVEVAIAAPAAKAISALRHADYEAALAFGRESLIVATRCGMIETFVTAYRGYPDLLLCLLQDSSLHEALNQVMSLAGDAVPKADSIGSAAKSVQALSRREKEVLSLLAQGQSNPQIAESLFISVVTVKVHVRHIFEKLGVRSRAEAALRASQLVRG